MSRGSAVAQRDCSERCARWVLGWVIGVVVLFGCGPPAPSPPPVPPRPSPTLTSTAEALVREARRLVAAQLNAPVAGIELLEIQEREWPDASLGCPEAGRTYAQVITPGYRLVLAHRTRRYVAHTSTSHVVLCAEQSR